MNKIKFLLFVGVATCTLAAHAQQNIERLLPSFATLENVKVTESIDNGVWSRYEEPCYSVLIENAPIEMIPTWLMDSLITAFEKELPLATESDRYQKHSEKGDTLSYTLAYNGTINPAENKSRLNVMNHHYSQRIKMAAALDIENKTLKLHYNKVGIINQRIWGASAVSHDSLTDIFKEIIQEKQFKTMSVSYDIENGDGSGKWVIMNSHFGFVHRKGLRVEIPSAKANDIFTRMFTAMSKVGKSHNTFYSSLSNDEAYVAFDKHGIGDVFCLRRLVDGHVFVLHIEKSDYPCDLAIPYNWHEVDRISRLKK